MAVCSLKQPVAPTLRRALLLLTAAPIVAMLSSTAWAQTPAAGSDHGNVYAFGSVIHTVTRLDQSVAFYHEVLALQVKSEDRASISNPALQRLVDAKGARFRHAVLLIPGTAFPLELVQFSGVKRRSAGVSRMQDPGNLMLSFRVRDVDSVVAAAKTAGATVLTPGGAPLRRMNPRNGTSNRAIFMRDPDGFMFELTQFYPQGATVDVPADSVVLSATASESAGDVQQTRAFWDAVGGVAIKVGAQFNGNATEMQLGATEGGAVRGGAAAISGSAAHWGLFQFKGLERARFAPRAIDPGAPAFSLRVHDIAAAMAAATAHGGEIVSQGHHAVTMKTTDGTSLHVFIRDPNGFLFELVQ